MARAISEAPVIRAVLSDSDGEIASSQSVNTELPAAALLADNAALPTTPIVGGVPMLYDGATLDMARAVPNTLTPASSTGYAASGVMLYNSSGDWRPQAVANAVSDANNGGNSATHVLQIFNGATYDKQRGNVEATVLASAARTATTTSSDQTNYNGRALQVFVNVTAYTAGGLTPKIQFKDALSGNYIDVLTGAKLVATGLVMLTISPSMAAVANVVVQGHAPRTWRVVLTPDDATSITYSVGANTLV